MKSFTSLVKDSRHKCVFYITDTLEDGRDTWFFLHVHPNKEKALQRAIDESKGFNLDEYGDVVASGFGKPSEEVKKRMKDEYNATI